MSRELPRALVESRYQTPEFVIALPALIDRMIDQWSLTLGDPFPNVEINYVAPATRADGTSCVFKISRHIAETGNEIAALRLWDGRGACRLLEADEPNGAMLIERLEPGTMLAELADAGDDDGATGIAADVLRLLWRQPDGDAGLRPLASWCEAYERNRDALRRGDRGFPAALFQHADALRQELLDSTVAPVALHGDMHHYNVLRAQRAEWLAIDPKGLVGDRHFDIGQFMRNPQDRITLTVNRRRLDIFCAELGLDRARARDWCFVHDMLDACWDYEDGMPWDEAVDRANDTLAF
jgi:streptomycin 6-kinase